MRFCVNCAEAYETQVSVCRRCLSDPCVPRAAMDRVLSELESGRADRIRWPQFIYPGERRHLLVAVALSLAISLVLGVLTLSLYFWMLVGTIAMIRYNQWKLQTRLVEVTEKTAPEIWRLVRLASYRLGVPPPPTFILNVEEPNAFTTGFWGDSCIVLQTGIIRLLKNQELLAVVGHEIGHIRYGHTTFMGLAGPTTPRTRIQPVAAVLGVLFNAWSLRAEYTADRASLIATRDVESAVRCQMKLSLGRDLGAEIEIGEFVRGPEKEQEDSWSRLFELTGTHPYPRNRVREIIRFSKSSIYGDIFVAEGRCEP